MTPISNYQANAVNWRQSLQKNNRRTFFVITIFFLIYFSLGMLVDVYIVSGRYPHTPLPDILMALLTLRLFPLATCVMLAVALISLLVTFALHDRLMLLGTEYREITADNAQSSEEVQLYHVIEEMKLAAGLQYMPKVYVIEADYMNAFASGYSEKSAMIAITRRLLEVLNRSELQAVMAHELSHIRHMDIKLTLMASVLANLMIMVLDIFFYSAMFSRSRRENGSRDILAFVIILLRYILPLINVLLLLYLSRTREYMADAGSVELLRDNQPLGSALLKIQNDHVSRQDECSAAYQSTPHENVRREAYIFDPIQAGIEPVSSLADIFSTHPNIKDRLAAIGFTWKK